MRNLWHTIKTYAACFGLVIRLGRLLGGVDVLLRRLDEMEKATLAEKVSSSCAHCGSRELEPLFGMSSGEDMQVTKFRCKACGLEMSF